MDKPTPKERVEHVLLAISSIQDFIEGSSLEVFQNDLKLQSAVLFQFLIIGEAIRHIDDFIYPNMIIHGIFPGRFAILSSINIMVSK